MYRGLVATFQAFQHGVGAFMATRLLLGLCESGFIPAGLFTITRWYKTSETSKRFAFFFIGNGFAQAVAGLLAYGILHMRGLSGLAGWQWLFILEGIFTVIVGVIFALLFPSSPANPVNLLKRRYFTERESYILVQRVLRDDPSKHEKSKNVTGAELRAVVRLPAIECDFDGADILSQFTNWRLIAHIFITICGLAPSSVLWNYAPTLVKGYGYGRLRSNAMVSIGQWINLCMTILWGFLALVSHSMISTTPELTSSRDKFNRRGPLVFLGVLLWWIFTLCCRLLIYNPSPQARFAVLTLAGAFASMWRKLNLPLETSIWLICHRCCKWLMDGDERSQCR